MWMIIAGLFLMGIGLRVGVAAADLTDGVRIIVWNGFSIACSVGGLVMVLSGIKRYFFGDIIKALTEKKQ